MVSMYCEHGFFLQASSFEAVMDAVIEYYADTQTDGDMDQADSLVREDYHLGIILVYGVGGDHVIN